MIMLINTLLKEIKNFTTCIQQIKVTNLNRSKSTKIKIKCKYIYYN